MRCATQRAIALCYGRRARAPVDDAQYEMETLVCGCARARTAKNSAQATMSWVARLTSAAPKRASEASDATDDAAAAEQQALRAEIEEDQMRDAAERLEAEKQRAAAAAVDESGAPPAKRARGASAESAHETTLIPPVPSRSKRTAGGALKPQGVVFRALYDRSDLLLKTLATLGKFYKLLPLTFTEHGLEVAALDATHMMYARLTVPRAAFVRFEHLTQKAIEVLVSTDALDRVSRMSRNSTSISFMYDQYGREDEVLHTAMFPRTAANASEQCMRTSFRGSQNDFLPVTPDSVYQYRVFVPGTQFFQNVKHLAEDASVISLMMSDGAFELAAVSEDAVATTSFTMRAVHKQRLAHDPLAEENLRQSADEQTAANCCLIERMPEAEGSGVSLAHLRGFKMSSRYLYRAMRFVQVGDCQRVSLRFGASPSADAASGFICNPLALLFEMRAPATGAAFTVELWIVPKMTEE